MGFWVHKAAVTHCYNKVKHVLTSCTCQWTFNTLPDKRNERERALGLPLQYVAGVPQEIVSTQNVRSLVTVTCFLMVFLCCNTSWTALFCRRHYHLKCCTSTTVMRVKMSHCSLCHCARYGVANQRVFFSSSMHLQLRLRAATFNRYMYEHSTPWPLTSFSSCTVDVDLARLRDRVNRSSAMHTRSSGFATWEWPFPPEEVSRSMTVSLAFTHCVRTHVHWLWQVCKAWSSRSLQAHEC